MTLTRRKLLAGLGVVAAGAGGVFGTAAFTQVDTTRDFDIGIAADQDAQFRLEPGETDAVRFEEVDGLDLLTFDFEDLQTAGDAVFEAAFTIENNIALDEASFEADSPAVWLYVPRALDPDDEPVSNPIQESTEFLVDPFQEGIVDRQGDDEDYIDLSLPPAYPGEVGDPVFSANPENPDVTSASALGKIQNTGAVRLEQGESVPVELRILDFPADVGDDVSLLYSITAQYDEEPTLDDWEGES